MAAAGAKFRRASSARRRRARNLELTIDLRLQHIAERELRDGRHRRRTRPADPSSSWIRSPAKSSPQASYPTFNPNLYWEEPADAAAQSRRHGHVRAGLDLQDRHGLGGAE